MSTTTQPPAVIASSLEEHDLPLASVAPISPTEKYLLRLVLFGAGKTILHRDTICEVVDTHNQIRQLLPLVNEDLSEAKADPFWVPRQLVIRRKLKREGSNRRRLRHVLARPPHFTGEPRPNFHPDTGELLVSVTLESRTPSPTSSGDLSPLFSTYERPHFQVEKKAGFHLVDIPVNRRTRQGFFSRKSVEWAVGKMRVDSFVKTAVTEVVFSRQSPTKVAKFWGLNPRVLKVYATRVRRRIRERVDVAC